MIYKFLPVPQSVIKEGNSTSPDIGYRYVKSHEGDLVDGSAIKDYLGGYSITPGTDFFIHNGTAYELYKEYLDLEKGNIIYVGIESVYGCDQFE